MARIPRIFILLSGVLLLAFQDAAQAGDANGEALAKCESYQDQIFASRAEHHSTVMRMREQEHDIILLRNAIAIREGRKKDVVGQQDLARQQRELTKSQAHLVLLERLRKSVEGSAKSIDPSLSSADFDSYFEGEFKSLRKNVARRRATYKKLQAESENLSSLDPKTAKEDLADLEKKMEALREEDSQSQDKQAALREQFRAENCRERLVAAGKLPAPEKQPPVKDPQVCDRLLRLAGPAGDKYRDASVAEQLFLSGEYRDAELIAKAEKDPRLFERAEKRIKEIEIKLAVAMQKEEALHSYRANPESNAAIAPLVEDLTMETATGWPEGATSYRQRLESARFELARIKGAAAAAMSKSADDRREAMTRLENKKTALSSATEAAWQERKKALEPYNKACSTGMASFLYDLNAIQLRSGIGVGVGGYGGLWDGETGIQNFGMPAGPAPGNYR